MLKYIIFDDEIPIVFPDVLIHQHVACGLQRMPISAGFLTHDPNTGELATFGESASLGLRARKGDADIIRRYYHA